MISPSAESGLTWFIEAIEKTRARYDAQVQKLWLRLQRSPENKALAAQLARRLETYVQDAIARPLVCYKQPDWDSNVWHGKHPIGVVTESDIPCNWSPEWFETGGVLIVCGPSRSGKSTFVMNVLRGCLEEGINVTVFDAHGASCSGLVREYPGQLEAVSLSQIPLGLFQDPQLIPVTASLLAETYGMKLSKGELAAALRKMGDLFEQKFGAGVPFSLKNVIDALERDLFYWPFDPTRQLRRTINSTLRGIYERCSNLHYARGASAKDIFHRNLILTGGFQEVWDHRFNVAQLCAMLSYYLQATTTKFDTLKHVVIFEDAIDLYHRLADQNSSTGIAPLVALSTVIGKLGVLFIVVTHTLNDISNTLLSNASGIAVAGSFSNDIDLYKATLATGLETRQ